MIVGSTAQAIRAAEEPLLAAGEPLMARAAAAVAQQVRTLRARRVVALIGGGNNGGDGLFAAADLAADHHVSAVLARDQVHPQALQAAVAAGVQVVPLAEAVGVAEQCEVWLDALAGLGLRGGLHGPAARLVSDLEPVRGHRSVVAVDIPSGVDADTGTVAGPVLPATTTVTFAMPAGLLLPPGADLAGEVVHVDIGIHPERAAVRRLQPADVPVVAPGRTDHKYTRGVVLVAAGSPQYRGAAVLTVGAALRTGTGMVRYHGAAADLVLQRWPEAVVGRGRAQVVVVGPGTVADISHLDLIADAAAHDLGLVVDAGALSLLAPGVQLPSRTVLTPHAGELAHLLDRYGTAVQRDQVEAEPARWALAAAQATGVTVLAKGATTVIASPDGRLFSQADGTGWLASAGSGDVLAGILAAVLADTTVPVPVLAARAALIHGRAARYASAGGPIVASDIVDALRPTMAALATGTMTA